MFFFIGFDAFDWRKSRREGGSGDGRDFRLMGLLMGLNRHVVHCREGLDWPCWDELVLVESRLGNGMRKGRKWVWCYPLVLKKLDDWI